MAVPPGEIVASVGLVQLNVPKGLAAEMVYIMTGVVEEQTFVGPEIEPRVGIGSTVTTRLVDALHVPLVTVYISVEAPSPVGVTTPVRLLTEIELPDADHVPPGSPDDV